MLGWVEKIGESQRLACHSCSTVNFCSALHCRRHVIRDHSGQVSPQWPYLPPRVEGLSTFWVGHNGKSLHFEEPFLKAGMLQIDKELQKDDVVDLVDEPRLVVVECLHLIAKIHIELFRKFAIHTEKKSILIES